MRSFVKINSALNTEITLSFTDLGKSCPSREFLISQICMLTLFAKNKILARISGFTVRQCNTDVTVFLSFSTAIEGMSFSALLTHKRKTLTRIYAVR